VFFYGLGKRAAGDVRDGAERGDTDLHDGGRQPVLWRAADPVGAGGGGGGPAGVGAVAEEPGHAGDGDVRLLAVRAGEAVGDGAGAGEVRDVLPGRDGFGLCRSAVLREYERAVFSADPFVSATAVRNPTRGWNRYAYVEGDPGNYWDPSGLCAAMAGTDVCFEATAVAQAPSGGGDAVSAVSDFYLQTILAFYGTGPLFEVPAFYYWSELGGSEVTRRPATDTGRAMVEDWLDSLKGTNCEKYFEPYVGTIRKALKDTHFYDVTGVDANRWVSQVIGKAVDPDFQLKNFARSDPVKDKAVTLTYNGKYIPHVLIWYSEIQQPGQLIALHIHEMLHVALGMGHDELTKIFGLPRGTDLSEWIDKDCRTQAP
jgi:hypothetical protein